MNKFMDGTVSAQTLILGIGNTLLGDDGVGVHVVRALDELGITHEHAGRVVLRDGGTIGLSLLVDIEDCDAFIAVDATEMGAPPGQVWIFEGAEMERQLTGAKRTAHEVGLADLMSAARLGQRQPRRTALVGIQPGSTGWGLEPTEAVNAAIPSACAAVRRLLNEWSLR